MASRSQVVLVTGASSGIGKAVASAFQSKGFTVFGTSRKPAQAAAIPGVEFVELDVTAPNSVSTAVATVIERAGRIDILINNAGVVLLGAAEESSVTQALQLFDTNFFGLVRLTNEVLPHLRAQGGGRIINIGSAMGFLPAPYTAFYGASKYAIEGYSESLDHETREFGIRVSVVEPGYTRTSIDAQMMEPDSPIATYAVRRQNAHQVFVKAMETADEPAIVAKVVIKAATSRKPKIRYPAGRAASALSLLKRFGPGAALDLGIRRANKLPPTASRSTTPTPLHGTPEVGKPSPPPRSLAVPPT